MAGTGIAPDPGMNLFCAWGRAHPRAGIRQGGHAEVCTWIAHGGGAGQMSSGPRSDAATPAR